MSREIPPSPVSSLLPPETASPKAARTFAQETIAAWRLNAISDDVTLIVAELITNSVLHSDGPATLSLRRDGLTVRISVRDESPVLPTAWTPSPTRTGGRGLAIVAAIATDWGVERHADGGKSVWAEVSAYA
jgi:serine/threonine-protein kinase RsbW